MRQVVSAAVVRHGRVLLAQRPPGKEYAYRWETPGGKVEPGESHLEAIRREMLEELGLEISAIAERPFWQGEVRLDGGRPNVYLNFYLVREWSGTPQAREGQGFAWFLPSELERLSPLMPGNTLARGVLVSILDDQFREEATER